MSTKSGRLLTSIASAAALATTLGVTGPVSAADDLMSQIEERGELRVCHAEDNPLTFRNPATNRWEGLTRDLAAAFAEELGVELVDVDSSWKSIIPSVQSGECDIGGGGLFVTVTRAKVVLFSIPFMFAHSSAVVHKDSGLTSYEQLDQPDKLIIGVAGTSTLEFAKKFFKKATVKALTTTSDAVTLAEIANKRADAYWTNSYRGAKLLKENPQFKSRLIGDVPQDYVSTSWAIRKGEYHFKQIVDVWLHRFITAGKVEVLWKKWYGPNLPYVRGDWRRTIK